MSEIVLVLDSVRSAHNVGSLFRVANAMGLKRVITTGITPHIEQSEDTRLPHVIRRATNQIQKTSLGAETTLDATHISDIKTALTDLKQSGFRLVGLEQAPGSVSLSEYQPPSGKIALIVGNEVDGIDKATLDLCDDVVEIEMSGSKDSLNVATAGAIALFELRELLSTS